MVVLKDGYGLSMFGDLLNPVKDSALSTPGLFRKAGPGPVTYRPVIALGLETVNRGGWYKPGSDAAHPEKAELWSYQFKHKTGDFKDGQVTPPPLAEGSKTSFDPGEPGIPKRVQRGGSFLCCDNYCKRYMAAGRGKGDPESSTNHVGFRCVKDAR